MPTILGHLFDQDESHELTPDRMLAGRLIRSVSTCARSLLFWLHDTLCVAVGKARPWLTGMD